MFPLMPRLHTATSVRFTAGKHVLGLYLGRSSLGSVDEAARSSWSCGYYAAQTSFSGLSLAAKLCT